MTRKRKEWEYQPSDTLTTMIKPAWIKAIKKAEAQIPKEIRNLSRRVREELHFPAPSYDDRTIREKIAENVRGMLTGLSRRYAHEHKEEVLIIHNGKFTEECQRELSLDFGLRYLKKRFYNDLACDLISWLDNRSIDDPSGFSYQPQGQCLYITMKKPNQPLQPPDIFKGIWEKAL